MDQVFKEFLYLAKPDREAFETVALSDCIRECVETLAPRLEAAGVTIDTPPTPLGVRAAPFALRRALLNVLTNAVQFSPRGGTVEVVCAVQRSSVQIDIADRGPGVPPHDRERIFDMFVSSRPEGTGLGLFLARTALRKCGGDIIARPREGGGSIFRITLPAGTETTS
jgi:signal transduction histidine kinase